MKQTPTAASFLVLVLVLLCTVDAQDNALTVQKTSFLFRATANKFALVFDRTANLQDNDEIHFSNDTANPCSSLVPAPVAVFANGHFTSTEPDSSIAIDYVTFRDAGDFKMCVKRGSTFSSPSGSANFPIRVLGGDAVSVKPFGVKYRAGNIQLSTLLTYPRDSDGKTLLPRDCDQLKFVPVSISGQYRCSDTNNAITRQYDGSQWTCLPSSPCTANQISVSAAGRFAVCYNAARVGDLFSSGSCQGTRWEETDSVILEVFPQIPGTVGSPSVSNPTADAFVLSWTASTPPGDVYRVTYGLTSGNKKSNTVFAFGGRTNVKVPFVGVTSHSYTVAARNAGGWGAETSEFQTTPPARPPRIVSFVAQPASDANVGFQTNDKVLITFDVDTNLAGFTTTSQLTTTDVDNLIQFTPPVTGSKSGQFTTTKTLVVTFLGTAFPQISASVVAPKAGGIKDATGSVDADSTTSSPTLEGHWGLGNYLVLPNSASGNEDTPLVNLRSAIQLGSAVDSTSTYKIRLVVNNTDSGSLNVELQLTNFPGTDVSISGTKSVVNNDWTINFRPSENFNGQAVLLLTVSKQSGTSFTDLVTTPFVLRIIAINDPPVIAGPTTNQLTFAKLDTSNTVAQNYTGLNISDIDNKESPDSIYTVRISVGSGSLVFFKSVSGVTFVPNNVPTGNSPSYSISGKLSDIQQVLGSLGYLIAKTDNVPSTTSLFVLASDGKPNGNSVKFIQLSIACDATTKPPVLVSATWSPEDKGIRVAFSNNIVYAGSTSNVASGGLCSTYFSGGVGSQCRCSVRSDSIVVLLSDTCESGVDVTSNLTLKDNVIASCASGQKMAAGTDTMAVSVRDPLPVSRLSLQPTARILGLQVVNAPSTILTGVVSDDGGRPAVFSWSVPSAVAQRPGCRFDNRNTFARNLFNISDGCLTTTPFNVTLIVITWYGGFDRAQFPIRKADTTSTPQITVIDASSREFVAIQKVGSSFQPSRSSFEVRYVPSPVFSPTSGQSLQIQWTISPAPASGATRDGKVLALDFLDRNVRRYVLTAKAAFDGAPASSSNAGSFAIELFTFQAQPDAVIFGGDDRTVGRADSLDVVIDGSKSVSGNTFQWACEALQNGLTSGQDSNCYNFDTQDLLDMGTADNVTFSPAKLLAGVYVFRLRVTAVNGAFDEASQRLRVAEGSPPRFRLIGPSAVSPQSTLAIAVDPQGVTGDIVRGWTFQWSEVQGLITLSTDQVSSRNLLVNAKKEIFFVPGRVYTFQLVVSAVDQATAITTAQTRIFHSFTCFDVPQGGSLQITPSSGNALTTSFKAVTSGWIFYGQQLSCSINYQSTSGLFPLTISQTDSEFTVSSVPKTTRLFVLCTDEIGGVGAANASISIDDSALTTDFGSVFSSSLTTARNGFTQNQDVSGLISAISALTREMRAQVARSTTTRATDLINAITTMRGVATVSDLLSLSFGVLSTDFATTTDTLALTNVRQALQISRDYNGQTTITGNDRLNDAGNFFGSLDRILRNLRLLTAATKLRASDEAMEFKRFYRNDDLTDLPGTVMGHLMDYLKSMETPKKLLSITRRMHTLFSKQLTSLYGSDGENDEYADVIFNKVFGGDDGVELQALTTDIASDAYNVLGLASSELLQLALNSLTTPGQSYIYSANDMNVRLESTTAAFPTLGVISFTGVANISVQSSSLSNIYGANIITTNVFVVMETAGSNLLGTTVINPLTNLPSTRATLITKLVGIAMYDDSGVAISNWNPSAPVSIQFVSDSTAQASCADCIARCMYWNNATQQWTQSVNSTARVFTALSTVTCDVVNGQTFAVWMTEPAIQSDSSSSFVGSLVFWIIIVVAVIVAFIIVALCCMYHNPKFDPLTKKKSQIHEMQEMEVPVPGYQNVAEDEKEYAASPGAGKPGLPQRGSLRDMHQDEVRDLARQWTEFFKSEHALTPGGPPQGRGHGMGMDEYVATQLQERERQGMTPGGPR